jgi:thiamine pyrophosphate-dependent acetolactate synthase large subunit-like protein
VSAMTNRPSQKDVIAQALALYGEKRPYAVADIGSQAGWLKAASHDARNLYLSGPMGLSPSVALGLALCRPNDEVLTIAGDGALAMNLSALVTIAAARPANLALMVVANDIYEFTASLPTPTTQLDWVALGRSVFGVDRCFLLEELTPERWETVSRPAMIVAPTAPSGKPPPLGMTPAQIRAEFLDAARG